MKVTGDIWAKEIREEHPGSIKGQFSQMTTCLEKRGKLKVQIKKSELLYILTHGDSHLSDTFIEAVRDCEYPNLIDELDYSDIEVEVLNG